MPTRTFISLIFIWMTSWSWSQNYNFKYLNVQKGLPQSQVYDIRFDTNQYAWIATQGGGVCRYNGEEFFYITTADSLLSNQTYALQNFNEKMAVACKGGVSVYDLNGRFIKNYSLPKTAFIAESLIEFDNQLWVGTNHGIFLLVDGFLQKYEVNPQLNNVNIRSFFIDEKNELWAATSQGLYHVKDPLKKLTYKRGLPNAFVTKVVNFRDHWLIATYGNGVVVKSNQNQTLNSNSLNRLNTSIILDLFIDHQKVWIATLNEGVFVWDSRTDTLTQYSINNGLSSNHIKKITKDRWGNIWIGSSGGGISIYNNSPFVSYKISSGLNGNYIYSVLKDNDDNLWVGTDGKGVVRINDTSQVLFDETNGYQTVKTKALFEDHQHNVWMGSEGKGIGIWPANTSKDTVYTYFNQNGLRDNWIKSFAQHPLTKDVYIGTTNGLYTVSIKNGVNRPLAFEKMNLKQSPRRVNDMFFTTEGILYIASAEGIGRIKNQKVEWLLDGDFRNICIVENRFIYAGTSDKGIAKINITQTQEVEWLNHSNVLNSNNIYQLLYQNHTLWVGTEKGLMALTIGADHSIISTKVFQYDDGFEGVETNLNACCIDQHHWPWFGTTNGLYQYHTTNDFQSDSKKPYFRIKDVQLFYESIWETHFNDNYEYSNRSSAPIFNADSELVLSHTQNHIGFLLEAIHYTYQSKIKYRWKLVGLDSKWTPASKNHTVTYSHLAPGHYEFLAQSSIDNLWDTPPLSFKFVITPPFWQTTWFKSLAIIAFLILVLGMSAIIYIRLKRKNQALRVKLEMEKSLIELEQKALRLQMNPHFIFNALNSIHNLIILNDPSKARYALSKFSKLMRRVLENSREQQITIDDEIETLNNYVQLEKLTNNIDFNFLVEVDEALDTNEPILPPLLLQPFVENSVIHGIKSKGNNGQITVRFILESEFVLRCEVEDNGIGRKEAKAHLVQKNANHKSTALQVTQERLANINSNTIKNGFEILDLYDSNHQVAGTRVIIRLKID